MGDSIAAGEIVATPEYETLSEASTGAVEPGSVTFPVCRAVIDEMLTVSEVEIARAMRRIAIGERWMVEGAAGVAVAGRGQAAERYRRQKVAAVLCGRKKIGSASCRDSVCQSASISGVTVSFNKTTLSSTEMYSFYLH